MKPSSRSIATGPGSRGGTFHLIEERRAWHRAYRRAHPEYARRDNALKRERRRQARLARELADIGNVVLFSDVLRDACRERIAEGMSHRKLARQIGVSPDVIDKFVSPREPDLWGYSYDAMVAYFGIWWLARAWAAIRRARSTVGGNPLVSSVPGGLASTGMRA